jgi:CDP-diacylglycerol--serine O-phosphatidyltransferase
VAHHVDYFPMIIKNIPNLLTLCNLVCGCIAIVFAFEGNLVLCAYLIGIACVFDFLDGMAARAFKVHSELGKQLDSLADMVSFGVVPGVVMYNLIQYSLISDFVENQTETNAFIFLPYIGFLIPVFSAIRLAKFNIDTRQSDSFIGVPTPANTIFIVSLPLILKFDTAFDSIIENPYFLIFISLIASLSLVAPLPLFALKFKNFSWKDNKVRYIFLLLALEMLIVFRFAGIPLIIILYIVLSIINNLFSKSKITPTNYE